MKVTHKEKVPTTKFDLVEFGDVCYYNGDYYLHTYHVVDLHDQDYNAISLTTGELEYIDEGQEVMVFPNSELNIQ